jgi:hypothetical protein
MPNLLDHLAAPSCSRLGSNWDRCGVHYVEPIEGARTAGEIHGFEVLRQPYCLKVSTRRARDMPCALAALCSGPTLCDPGGPRDWHPVLLRY